MLGWKNRHEITKKEVKKQDYQTLPDTISMVYCIENGENLLEQWALKLFSSFKKHGKNGVCDQVGIKKTKIENTKNKGHS